MHGACVRSSKHITYSRVVASVPGQQRLLYPRNLNVVRPSQHGSFLPRRYRGTECSCRRFTHKTITSSSRSFTHHSSDLFHCRARVDDAQWPHDRVDVHVPPSRWADLGPFVSGLPQHDILLLHVHERCVHLMPRCHNNNIACD